MRSIQILLVFLLFTNAAGALCQELVVYTSRKAHLIQPIFERFTKETGTTITFTTDKAPALIAKLQAEGKRTPADILITVDAGDLWHAANKGLLAPISSSLLEEKIPSHLRDPGGRWYGFSLRARTIVYDSTKIKPSELSDYRDLALPKWRGKLCLRTAKKVYNQSLVAMMLHQYGEKETRRVVSGWVKNLGQGVFANDTSLIEAIEAGRCEVGIVNSYYLGRLLVKKAAKKTKIFWPSAQQGGVHMNISGAAALAHAPHKKEAVRFLEWLASNGAQTLFANANLEFPVVKESSVHSVYDSFGAYSASNMPLVKAGELQASAIILMDQVGYK